MNRNSKWSTSNGSKRPRRQRYQLLPENEEEEEKESCSGSISDKHPDDLNLAQLNPEEYVEKILEPGETLRTLSLQFNCPIAELKRINHILRDNEIYARRKIKVPIKPGSVVSEKLAGVHLNNGISKSEEKVNCDMISVCSETSSILEGISLNTIKEQRLNLLETNHKYPCTSSIKNSFLEVGNNTHSPEESDNEDIHNYITKPSTCSGADWGISWLQLLICALLLGFAGPLLYILYMTEWKH